MRTPGAVAGLAVDPAAFAEDRFAAALGALARHAPSVVAAPAAAGDPRDRGVVAKAGRFYVWVPADRGGRPILDIETYLRPEGLPRPLVIQVAAYVRDKRSASNFATRLAVFEAHYAPAERPIEGVFAEFSAEFHYSLLDLLVEAHGAGDGAVYGRVMTAGTPLARVEQLYRRFRIAVLGRDVTSRTEALALLRGERPPAGQMVGYVTDTAVRMRALGPDGARYEMPRAALQIGPRFSENSVLVGYFAEAKGEVHFKVRKPLHVLEKARGPDARHSERGHVCATLARSVQVKLAQALRATPPERVAGTSALCADIQRKLLGEEEAARAAENGLEAGLRWCYLFNDPLPSLTRRRGHGGALAGHI